MTSTERQALRDTFESALVPRLSSAGWHPAAPDGSAFDDEVFVRLTRGLASDFTVRAEFGCDEGEGGVDLEAFGVLRLVYEPAQTAAEQLGVVVLDGVTVGLYDLDDGLEAPATMASEAEARRAAEQLSQVILDRAFSWAEPLAEVDTYIEHLRRREADEDEDDDCFLVVSEAVILGAAGRFGDGQAALGSALRTCRPERWGFSSEQEDIEVVTRWLAERGTASQRSSRRDNFGKGGSVHLGSAFATARTRVKAESAAKRAVKAHRGDKDRDELREMYRAELTARGLEVAPLGVESFLDSLDVHGPQQRAKVTLDGVKALVGMFKTWKSTISKVKASTGTYRAVVPPECELPEDAAYPSRSLRPGFGNRTRWVEAELDEGATALVDRLLPEPSSVPAFQTFQGWLAWSDSTIPHLVVNLGRTAIGTVPERDLDNYRRDLELAATLDLRPTVNIRLTRRRQPPNHLLEVAAPSPSRHNLSR